MTDFGSMSIMVDRKRSNSNPINIPRRKPAIWIPNQQVDNCFNCTCGCCFRILDQQLCNIVFISLTSM